MGLFGPSKRETELQNEVNMLRAQLSPEQQNVVQLQAQLRQLEEQRKAYEQEVARLSQQVQGLNNEISQKSSLVVNLNDYIEMQDYGLYKPSFVFANSDLYKDRLKDVRDRQKDFIKNNAACTGNMGWSVNGNLAKGQKMVKDMQKLLLRAFNVECDDIVANIKVSNFDKSKERMIKIKNQISDLGKIMGIAIRPEYLGLKLEELHLALDFAQKKQEEKERIREERERQREEAKVQKEIEEARKKLEKERAHYQNALDTINEQIRLNGNTPELIEKRDKLLAQVADAQKAIEDVDYREANKRAGYVYIISNIGAFGENVYKIGMTRRLEPMDRVSELGDASVPFNFDVHALIFADDAPGLEAALHNAFEANKVNKINGRREFFRVSLDDIKKVVRANFDKTVEWTDVAEADQYRQSLLLSHGDRRIEPSATTASAPVPDVKTVAPEQHIETPKPVTFESIVETISQQASAVPDVRIQREEQADFVRLHIFTTGNTKFGAVKIMKNDLSIQFRKMVNGLVTVYDLSSADEFQKYI